MTKPDTHRGSLAFPAGVLLALAAGWGAFPIVRYQRVAQPVAFSHRTHADKAGVKCDDCHTLRDDGTFAGVPALEKCAGCHTQPMGTSGAEKHFIAAYVTPNREVAWPVYARQPQNVYFSHAFHIKLAHLDCRQCHGAQGESDTLPPARFERVSGYSGSAQFQNMDACEDCHRQRGAPDSCLACHK